MFESRIQLVIACRAHDSPVLQFPNISWTKIPAWHLKEWTHLIKDDLLEHETLEFYKEDSPWGEDRRKTKLPEAHKHGKTNIVQQSFNLSCFWICHWMSHLGISLQPLLIQNRHYKIPPSHDKSQFGRQVREGISWISEVSEAYYLDS